MFRLLTLLVACLELPFCVISFVAQDEVTSLPGWSGPLPSKQYSGYLTVPNSNPPRNYHYWLVTSENDPQNDPTVFWFNGGPGASSLLGYFTEQGPFQLNEYSIQLNDTSIPVLFYNNYTWAKVSNIVFWESPSNVGFSYCGTIDNTSMKCPYWNDSLVASDNHAVTQQFFKYYPEYMSNEFYITGESYGGIYVPTLVMEIENDQSGIPPLTGFAVGDGCMGKGGFGGCNKDSGGNQLETFYGHGLISIECYNNYTFWCGDCKFFGNCSNYNQTRLDNCNDATNICHNNMGGFNLFNLYDECHLIGEDMKYTNKLYNDYTHAQQYINAFNGAQYFHPNMIPEYIRHNKQYTLKRSRYGSGINYYACDGETVTNIYLNKAQVKQSINVPSNIEWYLDGSPNFQYHKTQTDLRPFYYNASNYYRILIYYGDLDGDVPYNGGEKWTEKLGYNILEKWRPWTSNGYNLMGGYVQVYNTTYNFTYCTVRGSGHMVPQFQPRAALGMIKAFITNNKFPPFKGVPTIKDEL